MIEVMIKQFTGIDLLDDQTRSKYSVYQVQQLAVFSSVAAEIQQEKMANIGN